MIGTGYEVVSDLFGVADRLKEIDRDYFIFFSYRYRRFEVHNRAQRGSSLCLVLPYDRLDERTVRLVRRTRVKNAAGLLKEVERENAELGKLKLRKAVRNAELATERLFSAN